MYLDGRGYMVNVFYESCLVISFILLAIYVFLWRKHFDVHITVLFVLVPVANLGVTLLAYSQTLDAALLANKIVYIGGCYLQLILMLAVFSLCNIKLNRWIRAGLMTLSTLVYASSLTTGVSPLFYENVSLRFVNGTALLDKQYGIMHTVFIVMIIVYFLMSFAAIVYSYFKKNQVPRSTIYLLFLTELVAMVCFFGGRAFNNEVELLPAAYVFGLIVYLIIIYRIGLYDVTDVAIDSLVQNGDTGFASFDFKFNYLGSNETAKHVFPEFGNLTVDRPITDNEFMKQTALVWLQSFAADQSQSEFLFEKGDKTYQIDVRYLYSGKHKKGYQLFITDDTKDQQYIKLLNSFSNLMYCWLFVSSVMNSW